MKSLVHLTVCARVVGRRGPPIKPVELNLGGPFGTVRELLAAIVGAEVENFKARKEDARYFHLLTDRDIQEGLASGKILSGDQALDERLPNLDQAVEAAVTAFEDGLYYMFLNDAQVENLDEAVGEKPLTEVLFVRLTPLAGG